MTVSTHTLAPKAAPRGAIWLPEPPALKVVKKGGTPAYAIAERDKVIAALRGEVARLKWKHRPRLRRVDGAPTLKSAARVVGSQCDPRAVRAAWQSMSPFLTFTAEWQALRLATMQAEYGTVDAAEIARMRTSTVRCTGSFGRSDLPSRLEERLALPDTATAPLF